MSSDERELRAALDGAGTVRPVEPTETVLLADLQRGRKALRRQRVGVAAGAMCGVAAVAIVAGLPLSSHSSAPGPASTRPATPSATPAPVCPEYAGGENFEAYFTPSVRKLLGDGDPRDGGFSAGADPRCTPDGHQIQYLDQLVVSEEEEPVVLMNTVGMGVFGPDNDPASIADAPDGEPCALPPQFSASEPLTWSSCRTRDVAEGTLRIGKASDDDQCARGTTLFRDDGYVVSIVASTESGKATKQDLPISTERMREIVRDPSLVEPPTDR